MARGRADDAACGFEELRLIDAELKLHADASDDTGGQVDAEDFGPEASGLGQVPVAGAGGDGFKMTMRRAGPSLTAGTSRANVMVKAK